jgi:hypothetical protein
MKSLRVYSDASSIYFFLFYFSYESGGDGFPNRTLHIGLLRLVISLVSQ